MGNADGFDNECCLSVSDLEIVAYIIYLWNISFYVSASAVEDRPKMVSTNLTEATDHQERRQIEVYMQSETSTSLHVCMYVCV